MYRQQHLQDGRAVPRAAAADIVSGIDDHQRPGALRTLLDPHFRVARGQRGDARSGWKVGLTAKAIQEMEGFEEPIFACLYQSGYRASGARLRHAEMIDPAFENELCITLGEALEGPGVTAADVRHARCLRRTRDAEGLREGRCR